jgi:hypothetical protein
MTDEYEPPQATRANDTNVAHGACTAGSTPSFDAACADGDGGACYRGDDPVHAVDCITGKTALGCYSGAGV